MALNYAKYISFTLRKRSLNSLQPWRSTDLLYTDQGNRKKATAPGVHRAGRQREGLDCSEIHRPVVWVFIWDSQVGEWEYLERQWIGGAARVQAADHLGSYLR